MRRLPLAIALLALPLVTCARPPRGHQAPPPTPLSDVELASFLRELGQQAESVKRYQGLVRARGRGPEGGFDGRLAVVFERPHRLRVELLGPFGGTRWSAVANEEGITAYFPGRSQYLREPDVAEVVERLLGIRMSTEEVMAALSGTGIPLEPASGSRGHRQGANVLLELDPESGRTVTLDADSQPVGARGGGYRVSYPTSWRSRRRAIPDEIEIANERVRATLTAEDIDVNVSLDPEAFLLEIPADAVRLRPAEIEGEAVFVISKEPR